MNEKLNETFKQIERLRRRTRHTSQGDMNSTRNRALGVLSLNDGISQAELAYILGIRPQSAGELLRNMEQGGTIRRVSDDEDGRANRIYITDLGARCYEIARKEADGGDIFECLSEEEQETLVNGGIRLMVEGVYNEDAEDGTDFQAVVQKYISIGIVNNVG